MKIKNIIVALFIAGFASSGIAQSFISVADLAKKMNSPKTIIVSARTSVDYKKSHIRNAVNVPVKSLSSTAPIEGILKTPEQVAKILGDKGIEMDKEIVLYCNKGHSAGRMYWIMKQLGYKDVKLLDGNLDAWKAARKPVTRAPKMLRKCKVTPTFDASLAVTKAEVKAKKDAANVVLVDARDGAYFSGTDPKSKGHIPGAISISSDLMKDDKGLLKSSSDLAKLFESKGVTKDKEVILYCQTSTRAGLEFVILTSVLNYPNVKVYDGAYNEWSADQSLALAK